MTRDQIKLASDSYNLLNDTEGDFFQDLGDALIIALCHAETPDDIYGLEGGDGLSSLQSDCLSDQL